MSQMSSEGHLSPIEERVRQILIQKAKSADAAHPLVRSNFFTYRELAERADPDHYFWKAPRYRGIGQVLGRISTFEHAYGRPLLSALVVLKDLWHPGDGFAGLSRSLGEHIQPGQEQGFWRTQVEKTI